MELQALIEHLVQKRDLLETGDLAHEKIRTCLIVCGGAMRTAYGAGVLLMLQRLGFINCFDVVVGVSAGAPIAGYFLAGPKQGIEGVSIYEEFGKRIRVKWPPVDINYLVNAMRDGSKKLDMGAIIKHRSQFFVAVTNWETGEGELLNVKETPDPITALKASLAITVLHRRPVKVSGQKYTDGTAALPLPVKVSVERFAPTDLLVVANAPSADENRTGASFMGNLGGTISSIGLPRSVRKALSQRWVSWQENLAYLKTMPNAGIIWGPNNITILTKNPRRLHAATKAGEQQAQSLFLVK